MLIVERGSHHHILSHIQSVLVGLRQCSTGLYLLGILTHDLVLTFGIGPYLSLHLIWPVFERLFGIMSPEDLLIGGDDGVA
jgi:hypothetical protein